MLFYAYYLHWIVCSPLIFWLDVRDWRRTVSLVFIASRGFPVALFIERWNDSTPLVMSNDAQFTPSWATQLQLSVTLSAKDGEQWNESCLLEAKTRMFGYRCRTGFIGRRTTKIFAGELQTLNFIQCEIRVKIARKRCRWRPEISQVYVNYLYSGFVDLNDLPEK